MESAAARAPKGRKAPPYGFVLDALDALAPTCRPMFGCTAVYVGPRIVLILRQRGDTDDGVWVATTHVHHASLRAELPSLRTITVFGQAESSWSSRFSTLPVGLLGSASTKAHSRGTFAPDDRSRHHCLSSCARAPGVVASTPAQHHERPQPLAPLLVGHADDRRLRHGRVRVDARPRPPRGTR
jgi:hypothetical protein